MLINTNKSKILQFRRKKEDIHICCNGEGLKVVTDFTYLGTVIDGSWKVDADISNRINKANVVYYQICNTVLGEKQVGKDVKLHIFKTVYLSLLLHGTESWILTDQPELDINKITAAEMKFMGRRIGKKGGIEFTMKGFIRNCR
ncbi:uncharacterized protein [Halyomorpha halys]|uniref:uncharacterized protein n=1 Tax=Halyomorpha halys TaxID=286706 RepID=UPI0006D4D998|nr:uncharacterized protein LOC106686721 [Halyomorpha halys]